jgi:nucleoside-diphosphate-sugar epimerase
MRVFVAGATGALGRRLVPQLLQRGHEVVGTTRTPPKAGELRAAGAESLVLDVLDAGAVMAAVTAARPDVVVHEATALSGDLDLRRFEQAFAQTNRLRTEGTEHLLAAAIEAGAVRFVAQSYAGWPSARTGGPVKTEEDPLDPDPPAAMRSTLDAIRQLEAVVTGAAELTGVALRYGGFYGPGTSLWASGEHVEQVRKRRFPVVGDGGGVWSFIHIDDAASATVAAVERGEAGIYNVVDDEPARVAEWLPYLAQILGAPSPRHVPAWVGRLLAGEHMVAMMTEVRGSSNAKAKRELGWEPRYSSWREGFAAVGEALRQPAAA